MKDTIRQIYRTLYKKAKYIRHAESSVLDMIASGEIDLNEEFVKIQKKQSQLSSAQRKSVIVLALKGLIPESKKEEKQK